MKSSYGKKKPTMKPGVRKPAGPKPKGDWKNQLKKKKPPSKTPTKRAGR